MKYQYFLTLLIFTIGLTSCDCYVAVKGQVISSSTGKPIIGAEIEILDRNIKTSSSENGVFLIDEQTGFCYDPKIKITKIGYKPFLINIESNSNFTTYKVLSEKKSINFSEPIYKNPSNRRTFISSTWINSYSRNFAVKGDSLIIFLDIDDLEKEMQMIREKL